MTTFADLWIDMRARVLTRYAARADATARRARRRAKQLPQFAETMEEFAVGLERYAAQCRTAAADPTLPLPDYAGSEVDSRCDTTRP